MPSAEDYVAVVPLFGKPSDAGSRKAPVLARAGQRCGRVPVDSLVRLEKIGRVRLSPAVQRDDGEGPRRPVFRRRAKSEESDPDADE
jgi:hypothetical protein